MNDFDELQDLISRFAEARKWQEFHTPKNLAMAIVGEAGELAAEFQWLTPEESNRATMLDAKLLAIRMEMADVAIYLLRLAEILEVDLKSSIKEKMRLNGARFPI